MLIIWLLYLATTIFLGYSIIIFMIKKTFSGTIQLSISWLIGSSMTSLLLYIMSYIVNIRIIHIFLVIILQIAFGFLLFRKTFNYYFGESRNILYIHLERYSLLYVLILISTFSTFFFSINKHFNDPEFFLSYKNPKEFPYSIQIILSDYHIISQIIDVNTHNYSFFSRFINTKEIFLHSKSFSIFPHLYTSSLLLCGLTYDEASLLIAFFNSFSTAVSLFITFSNQKYSFFTSLFILFYSSFYYKDFPSLLQLLIISKEASFSIPILLFCISMNNINSDNAFNQLHRFISFFRILYPKYIFTYHFIPIFCCIFIIQKKIFSIYFIIIPKNLIFSL